MERIAKLFADNLRFFRGQQNLTQGALSERVGVTPNAISFWETGHRWPDPDMIGALAGALGVDAADLFQDRLKRPKPSPEEALDVLIEFVENVRSLAGSSPDRRRGYEVVNRLSPAELRLFLEENAGLDKD